MLLDKLKFFITPEEDKEKVKIIICNRESAVKENIKAHKKLSKMCEDIKDKNITLFQTKEDYFVNSR